MDCRVSGRVAVTVASVTTLRERATDYVNREIDAHVPALWRGRARLYVPLLVDRLVAFVELVTGGGDSS